MYKAKAYKVDDVLTSKKNYDIKYVIKFIDDDNIFTVQSMKGNLRLRLTSKQINFTFLTETEIRKLKLNKINESWR